MNNKLALGTGIGMVLLGGVVAIDEVVVTDKEWRVEIKEQQLDIRTDVELDQMLTSHQEKLQRRLKDNKIDLCIECVEWETREYLINAYGLEGEELEAEVAKQVAEKVAQRAEELEQLVNIVQ